MIIWNRILSSLWSCALTPRIDVEIFYYKIRFVMSVRLSSVALITPMHSECAWGIPLWMGIPLSKKNVEIQKFIFKDINLLKQVNISGILIPVKRVIQPSFIKICFLSSADYLWSSHTKRKVNAKVTSLYWVLSVSSLRATANVAGNWVQNPFCRDFAFALVWLDRKKLTSLANPGE